MLLRGEKQNICLADHDLIWAKLRVHTYTQAWLYVTQREINVWEGIPPKIISGLFQSCGFSRDFPNFIFLFYRIYFQ